MSLTMLVFGVAAFFAAAFSAARLICPGCKCPKKRDSMEQLHEQETDACLE